MDGGRRRPPFDFQFDRSDSNKRSFSSYSQMDSHNRSSPSPLFVRQNSHSPQRRATPPNPNPRRTLPLPVPLPSIPPHFPRDGYDYRRPLSSARSSTSANNIIDLTSDDDSTAPGNAPTPQPQPQPQPTAAPVPLPRFGREIIDLSADTSPAQPAQPRHARTSSSPEVQFVFSRPRSRTDQRAQPPPFLDPHPEHRRHVPELVLDDPEDDVIIAGERAGVNLLGPLGAHRRYGGLVQRLFEGGARIPGPVRAAVTTIMRGGPMPHFFGAANDDGENSRAANILGMAGMPGFMNYDTVAFDLLGNPDDHVQLPVPKFDPPPPAAEGFTRDPTEEDTIVCPNCEDELAVGESEEKRQVWVVKGCGHVYCGTCMNNRKRRTNKGTKGKGRADEPVLPPPFSTCQADDCGIRVSHKNDVMQIFL